MSKTAFEAAQTATVFFINGHIYDRIRHTGEAPCADCGVKDGEFHMFTTCQLEQCPCCNQPYGWCLCASATKSA